MASAIKLAGNERAEFAGQLAYPTTNVADLVPPAVANKTSEEATGFGEPRGISDPTCLTLGYCWKDFDIASRMTWKYLREVDSEGVEKSCLADSRSGASWTQQCT